MADLGARGQAFFDSLEPAIDRHKAATVALLTEAARLVDRLEDFDDIVAGKGVLQLLRFRLVDDEGHVAEVKFDGVMAEARQQQANLAALMRTILPNLDADAGREKGVDLVDQIAQRRASRRPAPASTARAKRSG